MAFYLDLIDQFMETQFESNRKGQNYWDQVGKDEGISTKDSHLIDQDTHKRKERRVLIAYNCIEHSTQEATRLRIQSDVPLP